MQKHHNCILCQQEARKKYDKFDKIDDLTVLKADAIPTRTTDKENLKTTKKLEDFQLNLSKKMDPLVVKAFTLYHQISSAALHTEWDDIVQVHYFTPG